MGDDEESGVQRVLRVVGKGAASAGRGISAAFGAIDPDLRRHAYQAPLAGLSLLVPRPKPVEALPDDGYRPLVLVHGLGGHPGNFFGLKTSFARRGRKRAYVVDFGTARSFDLMAQHLRSEIADIVEVNGLGPDAKVDVIGHSMGGLIARLAAEDEATRARIAQIVTLGTPHQGSHLARLASTELVLGLRPGSEIMQRLDAQDFWGTADAPLVTAIWSPNDTVVIPAEHAQFEHGRNVELAEATHYSYLLRPTAWKLVWDVLLDI